MSTAEPPEHPLLGGAEAGADHEPERQPDQPPDSEPDPRSGPGPDPEAEAEPEAEVEVRPAPEPVRAAPGPIRGPFDDFADDQAEDYAAGRPRAAVAAVAAGARGADGVGGVGGDEADEGDEGDEEDDRAGPAASGAGDPDDDAADADAPEYLVAPAVVAVVVTRDAGPYLEATLAALGTQDYPDLTVLVVDAGSAEDPTDRVAAVLPGGYVRHLDRTAGFGGAANDALTAVEGARFLLVCHDDVVLDPTAVRLLVEEAYRSNAAIVGPKLVEFDNPEILLDVGRAIDRLGGAHTGIEPGELDQEQHDGVRDVFYVSSAAMLVRTDLFTELGGFDPDTFPGSEDLDLCWRARLAGARIVVVPDARGAHVEAADQRVADRATARELARKRVRVVMTSCSVPTLLWVVPFALVLSFFEAIAFAFTRRRRQAFAEFGAWWWNLVHLGRLRAPRRRAQALRAVRDRDLAELQVGPSARLRTFLSHHRADERIETIGDVVRGWGESLGDALRHPAVLTFLVFLGVLGFGSRDLLSHGVPAVGQLPQWTGVHAMLASYGSAWRYTGLGSATAAPPLLVLTSGLSTVLLGSIGLARTLAVVGAFPVGAIGAYRLARSQRATLGPALVTAIAYAANPIARNAVAAGRFGPLVFFALAPFLLRLVIRVGRFDRNLDADRTRDRDRAADADDERAGAGSAVPADARRGRRPLLGLIALTAIATACYPLAAPLVVAAALALLVGSLLTRGVVAALRGTGAALLAAAVALALLFPWSLTVKDAFNDPAAFGIAFHPRLSLADVLRFHTGPSGGGFASWGLFATAAFALVVAAGPRLAWTARAWMLAATGFAMVYLPLRFAPGHAAAAPEGPLTLAALGLTLAAGIGIGAFVDELRHARFGWRQVAALLAGAGVLLIGLGFTADALDGRWHAPTGDWQHELAFTSDATYQGTFRILWLGRANVLPLDPFEYSDDLSYVLTRNGPGDVRELIRAPQQQADAVVRDAIALSTGRRTNRLGRLLAPMGVRYVAIPITNGPGGERDAPPRGLTSSLAAQLDLVQLHAPAGLVLYENDAWFPERAQVTGAASRLVPTGAVDPSRSALRTDLSAAAVPLGDTPVPRGTAVLGQAHDSDWQATAGGQTLTHDEAFGWSNAFQVPATATVKLKFDGQSSHNLLLVAQAVPWVLLLGLWLVGRRRDRARRRDAVAARRAERLAREERRARRAFDELELEDDFWSRV